MTSNNKQTSAPPLPGKDGTGAPAGAGPPRLRRGTRSFTDEQRLTRRATLVSFVILLLIILALLLRRSQPVEQGGREVAETAGGQAVEDQPTGQGATGLDEAVDDGPQQPAAGTQPDAQTDRPGSSEADRSPGANQRPPPEEEGDFVPPPGAQVIAQQNNGQYRFISP